MKRHMLICLFIFMLLSMEKSEIIILKIMKYLLLDMNFLPEFIEN
jgi:hypothetical protein